MLRKGQDIQVASVLALAAVLQHLLVAYLLALVSARRLLSSATASYLWHSYRSSGAAAVPYLSAPHAPSSILTTAPPTLR